MSMTRGAGMVARAPGAATRVALCIAGGLALYPAAATALEDDHGDTSAAASLLEVGAPRPGRIDDASDTDVFRLDLIGSARLEIRTSGQTDTRGELLDSTGARLDSDEDGGPGRNNFSITADLDPGVYYVAVSGADAGDYAISVRPGDAPDHGDTVEASTLLKLHTDAELAAVKPQVLLATAGRISPSVLDMDVFRIDVPDDGTGVTLRTTGGVDTYAYLLDTGENELAFEDGGDGNFRIEQTLDAGIYYARVGGHDVGAYRILGVMVPPADSQAGYSDTGDTDTGDTETGNGGTEPGDTDPPETDDSPPDPLPTPRVTAELPTEIEIRWEWRWWQLGAGGLRVSSFDLSRRTKGEEEWLTTCWDIHRFLSGLGDTVFISLRADPATTYEVRYRHRDAPSCFNQPGPDRRWSPIGEGRTPAN